MPDARGAAHYTILVADDNEVTQRLCRRVLEKAGHKVVTASDGQEAITLAIEIAPDVIFMDVSMPGMDGLEAMGQIKAKMPGMPVVISSAHSMANDRERYFASGADEVLSKPFKLTELTDVVSKLGGRRSAEPPQ